MVQRPNDLVVVLDAVNAESNLARKWTEGIRQGYLKRIRQIHACMMQARAYEYEGNEEAAVNAWCQVFGEEFRQLSQ